MPNYKIFQDNPDQVRIKVYGSQNVAFYTDSSGNIGITSTGLAIVPPSDGLLITSTGLAVQQTLAVTDVSTSVENYADTSGAPGSTYTVLGLTEWTLAVASASTTGNQALVKLQISPDDTNWIDNTSYTTLDATDLEGLVSTMFMKYARVYYAAVNASSGVTLNILFQGHS